MHVEPLESRRLFDGTILFIRGADGSGGFLEGGNLARRNEQLADINDNSTAADNCGWGQLATQLESDGFDVEQMIEGVGTTDGNGFTTGAPIAFDTLDLSQYAAIVFGSNNAIYTTAQVRAVKDYVNAGGAALFMSDANFGSNWRDSSDSDQQFLAHFSITANQDSAFGTVTSSRGGGQFIVSNHPVLEGVDSLTGEGTSPVLIPQSIPAGLTIDRIVAPIGPTRNNDGASSADDFRGTLRQQSGRDAALALVHWGKGRVAAWFDRNTFFNANGLGTDITEVDNLRFARNLFGWLADSTPPALESARFLQQPNRTLTVTFDDHIRGFARSDILLRDANNLTPIPDERWELTLNDSSGKTVLTINLSPIQAPGRYQFQINAGLIADDSLNFTAAPISFKFSIV